VSLELPSDEELLHIYGAGQSGLGSSYEGWAALWLDGYRAGALVRPNVETEKGLDIQQAWHDYGMDDPTPREFNAFTGGFIYGKRAVTPRSPGWLAPIIAIVACASAVAGGIVSAVLF